ncbi:hypothetical protein ATCVCan0610SP_031R [Acanthocystis turfacea Chlorella virus Can0610SP]|nr:hypothetical protein ATCVCan0610SP_031R [Acanthocystis turfacea Chlorella virus Can0610SP]
METRIQTALVRQLQRQIRNQERRENKMFYTDLRNRSSAIQLVNEHFHAAEIETRRLFDSFQTAIDRAVKLNKDRFDASVSYTLDTPTINEEKYTFDSDEFEKEAVRMFRSSNDVLFFKSLYSYPESPRSDSNNDLFYIVVGVLVVLQCLQYNC